MTTKHNHAPRFGQKFDNCPRCDELKQGAAPVRGWGSVWSFSHGRYITRAEQTAQRIAEIQAHDCKASRCSIVCTAFDW